MQNCAQNNRLRSAFPASIAALAVLLLAACHSSSSSTNPDGMVGDMAMPQSEPDLSPPQGMLLGPFALTSCSGLTYSLKVDIGGNPYQLAIDTGSSTTAVASSLCTNCSGTTIYTPGTGASDTGHTAKSTYADGTGWDGEVYTDTLDVGGLADPVTLAFVAIQSNNNFFRTGLCGGAGVGYDGILGLGPMASLLPNTDDFIIEFAKKYQGMENAFALQLCPASGKLWLGGYDPSTVASPMQYVPMSTKLGYSVSISDMKIDGTSLGLNTSSFGTVIVDSGSAGLLLPDAAYNALTNAVTSSAAFQSAVGDSTFFTGGSCAPVSGDLATLDASLPKVSLVLPGSGGQNITLSLTALHSYLGAVDDGAGGTAVCPIVQSAGSQPISILGDVVLSSLITVIDRANNRVGFAPQVGCP